MWFYFFDYGKIGIWSGEPTYHAGIQTEIASELHDRMAIGEEAWPAFIKAFHRYPKIVPDITGGIAGFILYGQPTLIQQKLIFSVLSTISFLLYLVLFMFFFKAKVSLKYGLIAGLLLTTDIYMLLYAGFPRQNMMAHFLGGTVFLGYLNFRSRSDVFDARLALVLGLIAGAATLTHYASIQAVYFIIAGEIAVFIATRKRFWHNVAGLMVFLATVAGTWAAADVFYYYSLLRYDEAVPGGVATYSVISGFIHVIGRIQSRAMAWKIADPPWWFLFGYIYRTTNPAVWVFFPVGLFFMIRSAFSYMRGRVDAYGGRLAILLLAAILLMIYRSVIFFTCARSLAFYTPVVLAIAVMGMYRLSKISGRFHNRLFRFFPGIILVSGLAMQIPRLYDAHRSIRGEGYINQWARDNNVSQVYLLEEFGNSKATKLLEPKLQKISLRSVSSWPERGYIYVVRGDFIARYDRPEKGKRAILLLEQIDPVVDFPQYNSHPLMWYEFPLRKEVWERAGFNRPVAVSRRIYRVEDLRDKILCLETSDFPIQVD